MQVRPMTPDDAQAALDLRVAAFSRGMHVDIAGVPDDYVPDDARLVAVDGGRVVGHLAIWPFHQAFHGRGVPMGGVAGVAVAIDQRGRGIGSRLLAAALDLMASHGQVISTLYPSTPLPYRRWGWGLAGDHVERRMPCAALLELPAPARGINLRPFELDDLDMVEAVTDAVSIHEPGGLIGGTRWHRRALTPDADEPAITIVAERGDEVVGLLLATKVPAEQGRFDLRVLRLVGLDRDVELALWHNVASHHSVAGEVSFKSQPADPLLFQLDRFIPAVHPSSHLWMTRLVDVAAAVQARGWPQVTASCPLVVRDPRRPTNDGGWSLQVDGGTAVLEPDDGHDGPTLDIGALSSLYTGFTTPHALARAGRLNGATDDHLATLADLFATPAPFLRDYF